MRALFDTNVLVSAAAFGSEVPSAAFRAARLPGNALLIPSYVIGELVDVAARKWPGRSGPILEFVFAIDYEEVADPGPGFGEGLLSVRDPKDLPVLRAALAAGADCIVSGDKDLAAAETGGIPVYAPAEFVAAFG